MRGQSFFYDIIVLCIIFFNRLLANVKVKLRFTVLSVKDIPVEWTHKTKAPTN